METKERLEATEEQWRELRELANQTLAMEPWKDLSAVNLLLVQEDKRPPLYFSVLGHALGEHLKGVNSYEGEDGLNSWIMSAMHEAAGISEEYAMQRQNSLSGYFVKPEQFTLSKSGLAAPFSDPDESGLVPLFLSYRPGFMAAVPDAGEVDELIRRMRLLNEALAQFRENKETLQIDENEQTLQCTKDADGSWSLEVAPLPDLKLQVEHIALENGEFARRLTYQPRNDRTLQIDAIVLGAPIIDPKYDRPCNPAISVILDAKNGVARDIAPIPPVLSPGEGVLRRLIDYIAGNGLPKEVQVSNVELYAALEDLCTKCGITLIQLPVLPDMAVVAAHITRTLDPSKDEGTIYMGLHRGPLS